MRNGNVMKKNAKITVNKMLNVVLLVGVVFMLATLANSVRAYASPVTFYDDFDFVIEQDFSFELEWEESLDDSRTQWYRNDFENIPMELLPDEPPIAPTPEPPIPSSEMQEEMLQERGAIEAFSTQNISIRAVSRCVFGTFINLEINFLYPSCPNNGLTMRGCTIQGGRWNNLYGEFMFGRPRINSGQHRISGLTPGGTYTFRAYAWSWALSRWVHSEVQVTMPGRRAPSMTVSNVTQTGFVVDVVFPVNGSWGNWLQIWNGTAWVGIVNQPSNYERSGRFTVSGLHPGRTYAIRFRHFNHETNAWAPETRIDVRLLGPLRTLTFNGNGLRAVPATQNITRNQGSPISTLPQQPTRVGHRFDGWSTMATGGTRITANTIVPNANTTYFAQWIEIPPPLFRMPGRRLTNAELNTWNAEYNARGGISEVEREVLRLVNIERANHGLHPLTLCPTMSRAARFKSQEMADLGYFAHPSPVYGNFANISRELFGVTIHSENLVRFTGTAEQTVTAWMNSITGHRENILNPRWTHIGIGECRYHWTQKFR
ncbi:MAG: CAP domain-containing protein [Defluviitaleaceae bacterium]|nr:CAP domain-containing protein [Defluviitaleaceae bacterium]